MHEYDVNERKEEPASLPPTQNETTEINSQLRQDQQNQEQENPLRQQDNSHPPQNNPINQQEKDTLQVSVLYPLVVCAQLADSQLVLTADTPKLSPVKKRQRRVYVADTLRCYSLRSRQEPATKDPLEGGLKQPDVVPPPPPVQAPSPTPTESTEYTPPGRTRCARLHCSRSRHLHMLQTNIVISVTIRLYNTAVVTCVQIARLGYHKSD